MAAAAALNVVKQIEGLADAPATSQMRDCLGQLVTSLQFFLDHPDNRVRVGSARTLLKLSRGYGDDFRKNDLTKVQAALERTRGEEADEPELLKLLVDIMEPSSVTAATEACSSNTDSTAPASGSTELPPKDNPGQVVLTLSDESDDKAKASITTKIIGVPGVVSVTLHENRHVIVTAKNTDMAKDPSFLEDLQGAIEKGTDGNTLKVQSTERIKQSQSGGASGSSDKDKPEDTDLAPKSSQVDLDEDIEPTYLDDEDEPEQSGGPAGGFSSSAGINSAGINSAGVPQWSFFSQSNWMTGRRVQEFDDDPTIAARLARAKQRAEERREEERSRIGFMSRWLGRGRG